MNKTLLQENKAKLLEEQARLKKILSHTSTADSEFPGGRKPKFMEAGNEDGENASESEQFANDLSVDEDLEISLSQVNAALERIEDGTYGTCIVGGEEIDEARLRARPAADTCVEHSK